MGLRHIGGISLREMKKRINDLPITVAEEVAKQVAPTLTNMARASFTAGQTVYGDVRPKGVDGGFLTLKLSGTTATSIQFVAKGTIVRCVLAEDYMKYLIGKYRILPNGDRTAMPVAWYRAIGLIVYQVRQDLQSRAA